ncbi:MAG: GWxTD domain-containing protein [Candidatus Zixiibacteriota bacterium]|nr:MAG: GWxTD domain-containing protein [candidate division Zixibacteria bacterium]
MLIALFVASAGAQNLYPLGGAGQKISFHTDYAYFKSGQGNKLLLEVYYKVFSKYLTFIKEAGQYHAKFEVTVSVNDNKGKQVDGFSRERSFSVPSYSKTQSDDDFRTSQVDFLLDPGKYKIDCQLYDRNAGTSVSKTMKVELDRFDSRHAQLSGVEFCYAVDSVIEGSPFNKGNWSVIPSVIRSYGGDSVVTLLYYHEIYQGTNKRKQVLIQTRILNRKHDPVYSDTMTALFTDGMARQIRQVSLSGIPSGEYYLDVTLLGRRKRKVDNVRIPFQISWSPEALFKNDFETALKQLEYIASGEEIDNFKKAQTPEERLEAWNNFWVARDPTPNTKRNEAKEDYYRRIELSNRYFGIMNKEGWRSDRGRIFIQYGEPDQIEDYPFETSNDAYQIWYYYHLGVRRKFIFIDKWGDGDYRLQYPYDGIIR